MNANLKSANGFVRILYRHGEKIGMAAILACVGILLWTALGVDRIGEDQKPTDLEALTLRVNTILGDSVWEDFEDRLEAGKIHIQSMEDIPDVHFPLPKYPINPSVLTPIGLRTDPVLFGVEDLEVFCDTGLLASADPDHIRQRALDAIREEKKAALDAERLRDAPRGDGRRPRRSGLYGRDDRSLASRGPSSRDGAIVVRPNTEIKLEGYEKFTATPFVAVLAKVPIEIQYRQYEDSLRNARGFVEEHDTPEYIGYLVQRALMVDRVLNVLPQAQRTSISA